MLEKIKIKIDDSNDQYNICLIKDNANIHVKNLSSSELQHILLIANRILYAADVLIEKIEHYQKEKNEKKNFMYK